MQVDDNHHAGNFSSLQQPWQHIYKVPFEEASVLFTSSIFVIRC